MLLSKYNRYDIDQRLTVDAPAVMHGPLQNVPNTQEENSEHCIALTLTNSPKSFPSSSASASQRSIFSAYWRTSPRSSPPSSPISPRSNPVVEQEASRGQHQRDQQRREIHKPKTYAYVYLRDPYEYFGIEEEQCECKTTTDNDIDDSSVNSYELFLRKEEATAFDAIYERRNTYPCFSAIDLRSMRTRVGSNEKSTQSDTVLFAKTSRSCLRKGRFSRENNSSKGEDQLRPSKEVSFESAIKIHLFQAPLEKWAPSGWSNWFGA